MRVGVRLSFVIVLCMCVDKSAQLKPHNGGNDLTELSVYMIYITVRDYMHS